MTEDGVIYAPATGSGGAISIIRLSGNGTFTVLDSLVRFKNGTAGTSEGYTFKYGEIPGVDQVLVSIFRAPHSYTGEDSAEISVHASHFIVSEVCRLLSEAGARLAQPGEFSRRAFLGGKMDLSQTEAVADLIAADSALAHKTAFSQMKGGYSRELAALRDKLLELSSLLELELDFSEEEVEFASRENLMGLLEATLRKVDSLATSFKEGNAIKNGIPVAIVGAPNSGKSTLLNALVGDERAIVSDVPGTTRDTVEEVMRLGGMQFRFIDTAGIRETSDEIEKLGIERSLRKLGEADIVLCVVDSTHPIYKEILDAADAESQSVIIVLNKIDLVSSEIINNLCAEFGKYTCAVISALSGDGLTNLRTMIESSQRERFSPIETSDAVVVTNLRHYQALKEASSRLSDAMVDLSASLPTELVAQSLRRAILSINSILGQDLISPQDTLNRVFERFCIGK